ncbi:glycoside hydrolase family 9 protein [Paenibacillus sp. FSL H8-0537]|uniref:glycoside hydrolase family 9 protein n=1 Tax=Paenibacillus sp. FSL H8-0537 TaxID=2921399 RepID=UPI003100FFE3
MRIKWVLVQTLAIALLLGSLPLQPVSSVQAAGNYNYAEALQKAIYFYETQRSGALPDTNRVEWRGDSGMLDGADNGVDLTGGWYDAGDHVKFGLPMAFSATMLAWSVYEYKEGYEQAGQLNEILDNLKWATDYFVRAHTAPNELWGQVGGGNADHAWWGPAEVMQMARPSFKITETCRGSDLAGETAAALASSSIVFKASDPAYSALLLQHAKELYNFADTYRGKYSDCITDVASFYNSWSGYTDELTWAATWLYMATEDNTYLNKAIQSAYNWDTDSSSNTWAYKWTIGWDDKRYGAQLLLARITSELGRPEASDFIASTERNLNYWTVGTNGSRITYSPGGLAWLDSWGSLRYAANASFLAFVYSDFVADPVKKARYNDFAVSQIKYMLGDNPRNSSYVVGYGVNAPEHPHHRTSHSSWSDSSGNPTSHRHTLYGALVGGPNASDQYTDSIDDYVSNEVATDYNAGFTASLAKMNLLYGAGQQPLANFPPAETKADEMFVEAQVSQSSSNFTEIKAFINNKSAWPARMGDKLSFRYFLDLSEVYAAGYTAANVSVAANYNQGAAVSLKPFDEANHIYYVLADFTGTKIYPGGQPHFRKEIQIRISGPQGAWNPANDYSYAGLSSSQTVKTAKIPVYDAGALVFGQTPDGGGVTPTPTPSATPTPTPTPTTTPSPTPTPSTTPTPTPTTTPSPTPTPAGGLKVQYRAADTNATNNAMMPHLEIFNNGSSAVAMNTIKLRYYFTADGTQSHQFWSDYAQIGSSNVQAAFVTMSSPTTTADTYLELSFTTAAGSISAGGSSGQIQGRISKTDWSNLNEANDYSFDATNTAFVDWSKVTLYQNGTLVWGIEP